MTNGWIEIWKAVAQPLYYTVAIVAAFGAYLTYRSNSRRERAKWAVQLYDKFYEGTRYKAVREQLDCASDSADVQKLVRDETPEFTDYLNFFELVAFLAETKQLSKDEVLRLFDYYLKCLKKHSAVVAYLNTKEKGFEQLNAFLIKTEL